jgi:hypothetical protein
MLARPGWRVVLFVAVLGGAAASAAAQPSDRAASGGSIRPERVLPRPGRAGPRVGGLPAPAGAPALCDPDTVVGTCPGTYTFNYGFTAAATPRDGGAETEKAGFAALIYVTRRVFIEVDNDNVISSRPDDADRETGFGDTTVYAGVDAFLEGQGRPGVSFLYGLKIPTASSDKGLGTGMVDHTLLVAVMKTFGRSQVELDVGDYMAGRQDAGGLDHFPFVTGLLFQTLGSDDRYKLRLEVGGDLPTGHSDAAFYSLAQLQVGVTKHLSFRVGGRFGLTSNVSRAGLYVGIKVAGNAVSVAE